MTMEAGMMTISDNTSGCVSPGDYFSYDPNKYIYVTTGNYNLNSVTMGTSGFIMQVGCEKDKLADYYALGIPPVEGKMYQLVCCEVKEEDGRIYATFKLV